MSDRVPSFFMLVPGPWRERSEVLRALAQNGTSEGVNEASSPVAGSFHVEVVEDGRLGAGFSWGRQGPLPEELIARVAACSHAALIEFGGRLDEQAPQVAKLGRALRNAGGVAVRMEGSAAASTWEPWLERLESGVPYHVYETAVLIVQGDDDVMFTCGMHHFDLPDAEIALSDARTAISWLDELCVFQLAEKPILRSGHTFRPGEDEERRILERWPDHRHHPSDGRHNPYGLWRLLGPGSTGIRVTELVPTFIPTLSALLSAAEQSKGRPLTRAELEAIVGEGTVIALKPSDASMLERTRGYADIEPELAWEQWQIVRG